MCGKSFHHMKKATSGLQIYQAPECRVASSPKSTDSWPQVPLMGTSLVQSLDVSMSGKPASFIHLWTVFLFFSIITPGASSSQAELSDVHMNWVITTHDYSKQTPAFHNIVPGTDLTTASLKNQEQALAGVGMEVKALIYWQVCYLILISIMISLSMASHCFSSVEVIRPSQLIPN